MKVQEGGTIMVNEFMTYPLTPVPYSLATTDVYFNKAGKARGFHFLIKDIENDILPPNDRTLTIEVGNALFHYMLELPDDFRGICLKLYGMKENGLSIYIPRPFPPVWGVADNTKEQKKMVLM